MRRVRKYNDLDQWFDDLARLQESPNDETLQRSIENKVINSSEALKLDIKDFLIKKAMLQDNLEYVYEAIRGDYPDSVMCIKTADDPFFEV